MLGSADPCAGRLGYRPEQDTSSSISALLILLPFHGAKLQQVGAITCPAARCHGEGQDPVGTAGLAAVRAVALTCPVGDAPG